MLHQKSDSQEPKPTDTTRAANSIKRRSVACKSCHSLKVKCTPLDPNNLTGPCIRCSKTGRQCEIDTSQPRRRKRKASPATTSNDTNSPLKQQQQHPPSSKSANTSEDQKFTQAEYLEKRIKFLEEELTKQQQQQQQQTPQHTPQAIPQLQIQLQQLQHLQLQLLQQQQLPPSRSSTSHPPQHQGFPLIPPQNAQQPYLPSYSSSFSSPGVYQQSPSTQPNSVKSNGYTYNNVINDQEQKFSPTPAPYAGSQSYASSTHSPYPVSLPPLQKPMSLLSLQQLPSLQLQHPSPYLETPHNIEISPAEILGTDDQIHELRNELHTLMHTQKASLSELTAEVLKVADKRTELINKRYNVNKYDCVDLGYITLEQAEERLRIYREIMYPAYPFIEIPKDMTAEEMRKAYRFLFTTIITVTALLLPKDNPALENQMDIDLCNLRLITTEVLMIGNKTLELLKCLMLLSVWYNSAELFHHRRYHLINSLCISMVHDLGLTGRAYFFYNREEKSVKKTEVSENPKGLEYRRLLLTVYFTSISISLFLRRRIQVYWTSYLEECCHILEATGDPGDLKISTLSKLNRMLERIHFIVHGNQEPNDSAFMLPDRLKYITSELQKDLSDIKTKIPRDDHCLISYYYSVQAYLHEPALHKLFTPNASNSNLSSSTSPSIISSIDKCSRSCIAALVQLKLTSLEEMTCMPLLHSSRVIYTAGMLLRLRYLVISVPSLATSTHFPRDSIEKIQLLATNVYHASKKYPSNNFLHKMRLVIALFSQTYSTQLQKLIQEKISNGNSNIKWERDNNNGAGSETHSLHILSQAAALERSGDMRAHLQKDDSNRNYQIENNINNLTNNKNNNDLNNLSNTTTPALISPAPPLNNTTNPETNNNINSNNNTNTNNNNNNGGNPLQPDNADLEFSYYSLNDEFWSDLLMNTELDQPLADISGRDSELDLFNNEFI